MTSSSRRSDRLSVIDPYVVRHVIDHPARGYAWSLRELAKVVGVDHATLGHLRTGRTPTVSPDLAKRLSEAVGCEVPVLFVPAVSTESEDKAVRA